MSCDWKPDRVARAAGGNGIPRRGSKRVYMARTAPGRALRKPENVTGRKGTMHMSDIDWTGARLSTATALLRLYEVTHGVVAKVGKVKPEEAAAQKYSAALGMALPVLDYQETVDLPPEVSAEAYPCHGARSDIIGLGPEDEDWACTCAELRPCC
jgi:hypothetical protein